MDRLQRVQADRKEYEKVIESIKENLILCTDPESLNDLVLRIPDFPHVGSSKTVSARMITQRAKELGCTFNKDLKVYETA